MLSIDHTCLVGIFLQMLPGEKDFRRHMKIPKNVNWEFKVKDAARTRIKWSSQINKLTKQGIRYEDIVDPYIEELVISKICNHMWFYNYFMPEIRARGSITKSEIRELKTRVNAAFYEALLNGLNYAGLPKSWVTPFYMKYYTKINNKMKAITKDIIRNYM